MCKDRTTDHQASTSETISSPESSTKKPTFSPESARPSPKAQSATVKKRNRKRRRAEILTDTPVKTRLENEQSAANVKKILQIKKLLQES